MGEGWGEGLLELLTDDEVEVALAVLAGQFTLRVETLVEAVAPVDAQHTDHRQEDADTSTKRALESKWVEILERSPGITSLGKSETVDGAGSLEHEWEAELGYETSVASSDISAVTVGDGTILVTTQRDVLGDVARRVVRVTVTTHEVAIERRNLVLIIVTQEAHIGTSVEHEGVLATRVEWGEGLGRELDLVELEPLHLVLRVLIVSSLYVFTLGELVDLLLGVLVIRLEERVRRS
jgi:hypothetical protein